MSGLQVLQLIQQRPQHMIWLETAYILSAAKKIQRSKQKTRIFDDHTRIWHHLIQRTSTNIGIRLISSEATDSGTHLCCWQYTQYASPSILKQSCLKIRVSALRIPLGKQYLTQNGYSRSFKVICFNTYSDIIILVSHMKYEDTPTARSKKKQKWQFSTTLLSFDAHIQRTPMSLRYTFPPLVVWVYLHSNFSEGLRKGRRIM